MDNNDILNQLKNFLDENNSVQFNQTLIKNPGIDLNARIFDIYDTILHQAARAYKLEYCRLLIAHGADPNIKNRNKNNVLSSVAVSFENEDNYVKAQTWYAMIEYLILIGIDCCAVNIHGHTALSHVCEFINDPHSQQMNEIKQNIVKLLLDQMANANHDPNDSVHMNDIAKLKSHAEDVARKYRNDDLADYIRDYQTIPESKGCYCPDI